MSALTQEIFVQKLVEMEGIDLQIEGEHRLTKLYDGGCNVGKLGGAARVITLLQRLQRFHHIDPQYVLVMMPGGRPIYGSMLVEAESDVRMRTLRDLKTQRDDKNRDTRVGYQIELTQAIRDEYKDIGNRFKAIYLFPDAEVILINNPRFPGTVFDLQRNMIPVVVGLSHVEGGIKLGREVTATVTDERFVIDGVSYPRANIFFRQD